MSFINSNCHDGTWKSASFLGKNRQVFPRIEEFCDVLSLSVAKISSFIKIQKNYLFSFINHFYIKQRNKILSELKTRTALNVIGDGRCYSPGFSARHGTCSFKDSQSNKIIDFALTNVGNLANFVVMEKIGFVELLQRMEKAYGFKIRTVTTDRHIQIQTFLEKVYLDIIHQFDVWHVSKSIKKKLSPKLAKCKKLAKWSKSIINHFWWSCRTCESDQKLLKERGSLLFHIRNRHTRKTDRNFTLLNSCAPLPLSIHQEEDVEWLEASSPNFQALYWTKVY